MRIKKKKKEKKKKMKFQNPRYKKFYFASVSVITNSAH